MTDAYYEIVDAGGDPRGERFAASDHVISTWGSSMQNAAPVSALLVRAIERCDPRDDVRLSRVVIDLLGPVPVTDELWVRARVERPGRQIELLSADMSAPGPDGTPRGSPPPRRGGSSARRRSSCPGPPASRCAP